MPGRDDFLESALRRAKRRGYQGPASDLPTVNPDELYSRYVPKDRSADESWVEPFNREFDFNESSGEPPRPGWQESDVDSVGRRSKQFIDDYFGGKSSEVIDPQTGRPYGKELMVHDAMHQFANVGNTLRGEELISIAEKAGATPLAGSNLVGLTQQQADDSDVFRGVADLADRGLSEAWNQGRIGGLSIGGRRTLVQRRGQARGSSLFRDANSPASFLSPPITPMEAEEMVSRGREFYDQVHDRWLRYKPTELPPEVEAVMAEPLSKQYADGSVSRSMETVDRARLSFIEDVLPGTLIRGGYKDRGGLPFGMKEQFMNPPLVPTVDAKAYQSSIDRQLQDRVIAIKAELEGERQKFDSPEQQAVRQSVQDWKAMAERLRESETDWEYERKSLDKRLSGNADLRAKIEAYNRGIEDTKSGLRFRTTREILEEVLGPEPPLPRDRDLYPVADAIGDFDFDSRRLVSSGQFGERAAHAAGVAIDTLRDVSGAHTGGPGGAAPIDHRPGGRAYLNPANLGKTAARRLAAGVDRKADALVPNAPDILLTAAAEAKQAESYQRALPQIRQAVRTGSSAAADLAGSVPLFDPQFRQAVERGDVRKAGEQLVKEYVAGAVAAPVVGAGTGVLQRLAPQAAARVLPVLAGAARVGNPVAVASQLGGNRRPSVRQTAEERRLDPGAFGAQGPSANPQLLRAEAARRRGGRWKVGPWTLPELGLTEAGGLFFR